MTTAKDATAELIAGAVEALRRNLRGSDPRQRAQAAASILGVRSSIAEIRTLKREVRAMIANDPAFAALVHDEQQRRRRCYQGMHGS